MVAGVVPGSIMLPVEMMSEETDLGVGDVEKWINGICL